MVKFTVTSANIEEALTRLGSLRATDDPVSTVVQEMRGGVDCCKQSPTTHIGHFAVPDNGTGTRFKKIAACKCCFQIRVDDNGRFVKGSLRDYVTSLVTKHKRIDVFIENPAAVGPRPIPVR